MASLVVAAAGLDEGLFTTNSSLLGPSIGTERSQGSAEAPGDVSSVELRSEAGMDYTDLRDALAAGEFEKADDITRADLIKLAGPDAEKRGWVYFSEVKFISDADLQTIDNLWKASSGGRFGFSVQKELWLQNSQQWTRLFQKIDWTQGAGNYYRKWPKEFMYDLSAPKGHLPLTNCLRGTQLFKAILEHPAFAKTKSASSTPDWMK